MPLLDLNDAELRLVRSGALEQLHNGLERTVELADQLRQQGDMDEGPTAADLRRSLRDLLAEIGALEALGWHDERYRNERKAI